MAWTLQKLIDGNMVVTAHCRCGKHRILDLKGLLEQRGDIPAMSWDLAPRLKCEDCDERNPHLTYTPDSSQPSKWINPYLKAKDGR